MKKSRKYGKLVIDFDDNRRLWISNQAEKLLQGFNINQIAQSMRLTMECCHIHCAMLRKWEGCLVLQMAVPRFSIVAKLRIN